MRTIAQEVKEKALALYEVGNCSKKEICEKAGLSYPALQHLIEKHDAAQEEAARAAAQTQQAAQNGVIAAIVKIRDYIKAHPEEKANVVQLLGL